MQREAFKNIAGKEDTGFQTFLLFFNFLLVTFIFSFLSEKNMLKCLKFVFFLLNQHNPLTHNPKF